jgi:hypothetical protein
MWSYLELDAVNTFRSYFFTLNFNISSQLRLCFPCCNFSKGFPNKILCVGFQVLTATSMKMKAFWDAVHSRKTEAVTTLKRRLISTRLHGAASLKIHLLLGLQRCVLPPWWWRQHAPLKRRSTSIWLHGSISQKALNFILAAVRTWNLTCIFNAIP